MAAVSSSYIKYLDCHTYSKNTNGDYTIQDLPLIDAPLVKGKKFKEFFHIVENVSPAAYEELMAAMKTDPSNMSLLPPMLRPRDALGDQRKLQIFAADAGDGTFTVIKFFHSKVMIPLGLAKAFCHQKSLCSTTLSATIPTWSRRLSSTS